MDLVQFDNKLKKESWDVSKPSTVLEYYQKKDISRDYACYLLKNIEETAIINQIQRKALILYCKIHPKNDELLKYLEFNVVSSSSIDTKFVSMILGKKYFGSKMKKIIEHGFISEPHFLNSIIGYRNHSEMYMPLRYVADDLGVPILQLYLYQKWFFDKNAFYYNNYQKRLYGRYQHFHGNLTFKIQSYDGEERIYDIKDKTTIIQDFNYDEIKERDVLEVEFVSGYYHKGRKIINIKDVSPKYCFGISYTFFRRIIKKMRLLFKLETDDYFFSFIRNNTVYFLYIDVPAVQLEILIPAKRCKK